MSKQLALFEEKRPEPQGLRYAADFVSPTTEMKLILAIRTLPLQPFQFGEFEGKRRVASFGFRYDYDLRKLQRAEPIPAWLAEIVGNVPPASYAFASAPQRHGIASLDAEPRSLYMMSGASRLMIWEHSIPAVEAPRYSITFRTMTAPGTPP